MWKKQNHVDALFAFFLRFSVKVLSIFPYITIITITLVLPLTDLSPFLSGPVPEVFTFSKGRTAADISAPGMQG